MSGIGTEDGLKHYLRDEALNPNSVETLLRDEIMNMSMKDRTTIHEEIHGVHCMAIPETPRLLERSLKELDAELAKIHPSEKRAFCQASAQNNNATATATASAATDVYGRTKNYVDTDEFRSRFLRCELFDAKKAAHRLVNYLDLIAYCLPFENGSVVLHRPITLSDFNEAEHTIIRKGHMQLLPFRDRSGRRVLAGVASVGINFDFRTWYKMLLYFMLTAGEDLESQQKGIVIVAWPNADLSKQFKLRYPMHTGGRLLQMILQFAPVRVTAFHFCMPGNDPFFRVLQSVFTLFLGVGRRSRLKVHAGGPPELKYQLAGYGIPVDLLPMTSTGNIKTTNLRQWIRLRNIYEEDILVNGYSRGAIAKRDYPEDQLIECPGSRDVVFRPGKPVMNHPGNVTFRSLIESMSRLHELASQTQKATIARDVVDEMIDVRGGRFLVWDDNSCCWRAITEPHQQRHKVAIAFRNFKSYKKALKNRQTVQSSPPNNSVDAENAMTFAFQQLDHGSGHSEESSGSKRKRCSMGKNCF